MVTGWLANGEGCLFTISDWEALDIRPCIHCTNADELIMRDVFMFYDYRYCCIQALLQ